MSSIFSNFGGFIWLVSLISMVICCAWEKNWKKMQPIIWTYTSICQLQCHSISLLLLDFSCHIASCLIRHPEPLLGIIWDGLISLALGRAQEERGILLLTHYSLLPTAASSQKSAVFPFTISVNLIFLKMITNYQKWHLYKFHSPKGGLWCEFCSAQNCRKWWKCPLLAFKKVILRIRKCLFAHGACCAQKMRVVVPARAFHPRGHSALNLCALIPFLLLFYQGGYQHFGKPLLWRRDNWLGGYELEVAMKCTKLLDLLTHKWRYLCKYLAIQWSTIV